VTRVSDQVNHSQGYQIAQDEDAESKTHPKDPPLPSHRVSESVGCAEKLYEGQRLEIIGEFLRLEPAVYGSRQEYLNSLY
jgi:hypothetical protein